MIKAIVFDKDGTLIDYDAFWKPVAQAAVKKLLSSHGCGGKLIGEISKDLDKNYDTICRGTYAELADYLNKSADLSDFSPITPEETSQVYSQCAEFGKIIPACDDIIGFFANLKKRGIICAVVTIDSFDSTEYCLRSLGILDCFDRIYTDDGIHPPKPDPYYMNMFLKEYGLEKNEVIMVGDMTSDMLFAQNSKVYAVGVAKTAQASQELSENADIVVRDISFITNFLDK